MGHFFTDAYDSCTHRDAIPQTIYENIMHKARDKQENFKKYRNEEKKYVSSHKELKLVDYMMRKEGIENSTLTGYVKGKKDEDKTTSNQLKVFV